MTPPPFHLGLTGYPLGHSLSPRLHAAALEQLGLAGEYRLYPVPPLPEGAEGPPRRGRGWRRCACALGSCTGST